MRTLLTATISDSTPSLSKQFPSTLSSNIFLLSTHGHYQRSRFCQEHQRHFPRRLTKTCFLGPLPLAPPWCVSTDQPRCAPGLNIQGILDAPTKRKQSSLRMVSNTRQKISSVSEDKKRRHIVETVAFHPPENSCCILTHQKGRCHWHCRSSARAGILPNPILSTPLHHWHSNTLTARSKYVRNPSKGTASVISIATFTVSRYLAIIAPSFSNFRLSREGEENHKSPHCSGQGTSRS